MLAKFRTYRALGLDNLVRVATYRLGLRLGVHPVLKVSRLLSSGPFFRMPDEFRTEPARREWLSTIRIFAYHDKPIAGIPDWHKNQFSGAISKQRNLPWHKIPDFQPSVGDIKTIWDLSRFDWILAMAQRAATGDATELERLNHWLADWTQNNPPYDGINWKCGQEASVRVMHLAAASLLLGQTEKPERSLADLIETHLRRIAPTMNYAIGQSNNHGTSEAAALFIGGVWLSRIGVRGAEKWAQTGRKWLEERAQALISPDGSFSQYSVIYHRMVLDTYTLCEIWRRHWHLEPFSAQLQGRLVCAVAWLESMVDIESSDAPNLGANDGTQIVKLSDAPYRDFRPSLQRASLLFRGTRAVAGGGPWDDEARWLGINTDRPQEPPVRSMTFDDGGYHVLRKGTALVMLRYPRFRFRPAQADALHLDFWRDGVNILRDGGSFSYNHPESDDGYFASVRAHNTVEFDGRDQMPKLSRFLYGDWLAADFVEPVTETGDEIRAAAGYADSAGASHRRNVALTARGLTVIDTMSGIQRCAKLRFRLPPGQYEISKHRLSGNGMTISISSNGSNIKLGLVEGRESLHYFEQSQIPVLEVEIAQDCSLTTQLTW